MTQVPNPHEPGEVFGPYRLERRLGRGAAAEVWLAVETGDMGFSKRQALKLLRPPPGELEAQKKALINEARVCGRLGHPGIVDVYRVGEQSGELFIAMEFVDGPDLNSLLEALRAEKKEIPLGAGIDLCIELCEALDHAHNACEDDGSPLAIIHRDLKPSNVLVDRRGLVKISDWGLVKSTLNIESTTRGIVKGTPGYIAPEVWGGTRNFRPSVDLFAVGAMLYEVVVGKRLFTGRNLARIAEQVARRKPTEEAGHAAERAPALVPILEKVLQRVPDRRYQVAIDLADDLRDVRDTLAARDNFKSFLRGVKPVVERLAPRSLRSGENSRPSKRISDPRHDAPTPSEVIPRPASLGPGAEPTPAPAPKVAGTRPPPPSVSVEDARTEPATSAVSAPPRPDALPVGESAAEESPPKSAPAKRSEPPPTRAMAPDRGVADTTSAPRITAADIRTSSLNSVGDISVPETPTPAPTAATIAVPRHQLPTLDTGDAEPVARPKKKRRKTSPGGKRPRKKEAKKRAAPSVRDPTVRPPPPTSAVVVVTVGLLILLAGILLTFLK